ncbi:MAG: cell division protein, partial [Alphaproteobacteria bacterium]|nr:cell division protein [Alphaproteobacteria bacterium]
MFWRRHSDLPLRGDASSRFLPWIVAVMVFLAVLAVAGLLAAQEVVGRWQWALSGTLTVQVPPPVDAAGATNMEDRIGKAVELLRRTPGVASSEALSEAETRALLEPWLGAGAAIDGL